MGVGTIESVRFLDFTNAAGGGQALTVLELLSHQHNGLGQVQSGLVIIALSSCSTSTSKRRKTQFTSNGPCITKYL